MWELNVLEMPDDNIVDFNAAKSDFEPIRKEKAAKAVRKQFQKAMGWKTLPKTKKNGSKGPAPKRGKKR